MPKHYRLQYSVVDAISYNRVKLSYMRIMEDADPQSLVHVLWAYSCQIRGLAELIANQDRSSLPLDAEESSEGIGMLLSGIGNGLRELSCQIDESQARRAGSKAKRGEHG